MLKFALFNFKTEALNSFSLPPYKGGTFRGAFGYTIKKIACVKNRSSCEDCILKSKCIYSYIFETPPPENSTRMKKYTAAPHPFIIEPAIEEKTSYKKGDKLDFSLTLTGKAIDYLPYFVYAFEEIGNNGLGKNRGCYFIEEVINKNESNEGKVIYKTDKKLLPANFIFTEDTIKEISENFNDKKEITLDFLTHTRVLYQEKLVTHLDFHVFIRNILRRISLISYFHCGKELDLDFKGIIERAKEVIVKNSSLYWHDWERYSNRKKRKMTLGGFKGKITYEGNLQEFLPFIITGKYIHLGKGSAFGMGKYEVCFS